MGLKGMKTMYKDLVFMANQIGDFYKNYPTKEEAIEGITNHLQKFWSPVMRQRIISYVEENGGSDLSPLVREAIVKLKRCS
ncbi:NAD-dependent formate dehydrogenase delta subunit [Methylacidiphilum infernorum V4]|uniref:Formate dehydrogenase delta subunit n=2 Tax=Candidatus Methylacidiphilum infernorum TaxID=511746 RepID=A9QPG7_METI4|nr:formate dehydrogenase delta subunit [Methylacidiphilum infernorum V4]ACD83282.1 NAD-dependent formate dehydrogenase delta subunit [Methylacidiphilum infernorum V4]